MEGLPILNPGSETTGSVLGGGVSVTGLVCLGSVLAVVLGFDVVAGVVFVAGFCVLLTDQLGMTTGLA